jgi:hypothetical protein
MRKAGIPNHEELIADCSTQPGKKAIQYSYERFDAWLDTNRTPFTGLFCVGWTGALAAMRALRERKIDPAQGQRHHVRPRIAPLQILESSADHRGDERRQVRPRGDPAGSGALQDHSDKTGATSCSSRPHRPRKPFSCRSSARQQSSSSAGMDGRLRTREG